MSYDPSNIFAKILRGEIPNHKVYEDETALVMMDIPSSFPRRHRAICWTLIRKYFRL